MLGFAGVPFGADGLYDERACDCDRSSCCALAGTTSALVYIQRNCSHTRAHTCDYLAIISPRERGGAPTQRKLRAFPLDTMYSTMRSACTRTHTESTQLSKHCIRIVRRLHCSRNPNVAGAPPPFISIIRPYTSWAAEYVRVCVLCLFATWNSLLLDPKRLLLCFFKTYIIAAGCWLLSSLSLSLWPVARALVLVSAPIVVGPVANSAMQAKLSASAGSRSAPRTCARMSVCVFFGLGIELPAVCSCGVNEYPLNAVPLLETSQHQSIDIIHFENTF